VHHEGLAAAGAREAPVPETEDLAAARLVGDLEPDRRWRAIMHELAGLATYYVGGGHLFEDPATATTP